MSGASLTQRVLDGDVRAIARAISLVEDDAAAGADLLRQLFAHTGRAYIIGLTGPPGAGKSTLADRLISHVRGLERSVAVIAVDPTSPFTGGALLGDRVRMQAHAGDAGVFIRSMATRGHLGGLSHATSEVAAILDAAGMDVILIETVGVGQDEVDIVRTADVSIVIVVPGAGDEVQALKAGIMEIADIFVVNKADREGADRAVASIEAMLTLHAYGPGEWRPAIVKTEATTGTGVAELHDVITRFREHPSGTAGRQRARTEWRLRELLSRRFLQHVEGAVLAPGELARLIDQVGERGSDPYTVADDILSRALRGRAPLAADQRHGGEAHAAFPMSRAAAPATLAHVGIAVADAKVALEFYRDALGLEVESSEEVSSQQVRAHFIPLGSSALELLEATDPESPIARFLARRGAGLHHITLRVEDLAATLTQLKARGVRLIDDAPRPGAHGSRVAFIHPSSAQGVLVELVEGGSFKLPASGSQLGP